MANLKVHEEVGKALAFIKKQYGATAMKFEFEGNLERDSDNCYECDDSGFYDDERTRQCEECEEQSVGWCNQFMLDNVSDEARDALTYAKFYNDGSVDSEFTFTLKIDKAHLVTEYMKAWNKLVEYIGNGCDVDGAGFHIAIINSTHGTYPSGCSLDGVKTENFVNSMTKLIPALLFLASPDHRSRSLEYRHLKISDDKYSVINFGNRVFEYRVFETCYDKPDAVLDYICVIANTLKFYTTKQVTLEWFGKIGALDFAEGRGLDRFYHTEKHITALNKGLTILKPSYKTITALKKERGGGYTGSEVNRKLKKKIEQITACYDDYKERSKERYERRFKQAEYEWIIKCNQHGEREMLNVYRTKEKFIEEYTGVAQELTLKAYIKERLKSPEYGVERVTI